MKQALFSFAAAAAATVVAVGIATTPVRGQGGTGTIVGHVRYMGPTPVNSIIRMGADPRCNKLYAGTRPRSQAFIVGAEGGFANVLVNLDGSFPSSPVPSTPVVLDQKDCQYTPRVLGARIGQTLQVRNDDPTEHNVHSASMAGNDFNTTQPSKGQPFEYKLKAGEILRVRCDNHTWMTGFIGIFDHPYFAVSGNDGAFTIENVPAGRQTVRAWHEVMGMQMETVDIQPGKTTTVDFTFAPTKKGASIPIRELVIPAGVQMASILTRQYFPQNSSLRAWGGSEDPPCTCRSGIRFDTRLSGENLNAPTVFVFTADLGARGDARLRAGPEPADRPADRHGR